MITRRNLLKRLSALPLMGGLFGTHWAFGKSAMSAEALPARNVIQEMGLRTFINAAGNYTSMTASLMPPEVMGAIQEASRHYVMLDDLQDAVGARIAELCHAEAAMVTAGCWSALVLGTAGVLTGTDTKKIAQLPFLAGTGMKSEIILQKSHANGYHHALTNTGAKLILIETREELDAAINENTAMMWYLNRETPVGQIKHEEWIAIARKHGIPTMNDIAADVPPVENLWKYNDMGFDLVAISGGKALCGPQSAGILMGKKDLIAAARLNAPPRGGNIGRGNKVNKEEIIGMLVALETFINRDHEAYWKEWERKVAFIAGEISGVPGFRSETFVPEIANENPTLKVSWDKSKVALTGAQLGEKLRKGSPSIETISWEGEDYIRVAVFTLNQGEEKVVAKRLGEELLAAVS
ncbi:L-seryl-tRNA(Sec) selenium transferase-related protein [Lunatimonas lonarensis]|uniref:L-seryl-tRNA(Sec) selenium transferase-related protein n=1 Tax=Lunatimonas lonarensis TaxID=1232681 RepID=R7ZYT7_9BACT|nr:aminotransferase class V-fold PLP-dependent enzyme [Lunatimonas lonarensis]EON79219.1 L-seryl-tRNA(Sec) selenium transferase-related protein [Lunatimonas lonarensis]